MNGLFDMVVGHSIMRWLEHITITKLINLVGPMHSIHIDMSKIIRNFVNIIIFITI